VNGKSVHLADLERHLRGMSKNGDGVLEVETDCLSLPKMSSIAIQAAASRSYR
jgi:hypothetical protein